MWSMKYNSLNQYLRNRFGCKVYKIAINGGFTCPNRDGTISTGGCIFCSGYGSGDFTEEAGVSVTEQIERGKNRIAGKMPKADDYKNKNDNDIVSVVSVNDAKRRKEVQGKYIAYFQSFTNTYAPVERLRELYNEAISNSDIVAISIATRPDCIPEDVLDLLSELNGIKPVWVELGLQTIHEKTARYIRRGYELDVYDEAVKRLRERQLEVITHVILGLPGETREEMLDTVRYVGKSGVQGIKLQLLHVIKGTELAKDYGQGLFECMTMDEYTDLIRDCIAELPKDIVIHRMTGDGARKTLIAPMWSTDKKRVLNEINRKLSV